MPTALIILKFKSPLQEAFDAGVTVAFLMAAHEAEKRIYLGAGFSTTGEILHISFQDKIPQIPDFWYQGDDVKISNNIKKSGI